MKPRCSADFGLWFCRDRQDFRVCKSKLRSYFFAAIVAAFGVSATDPAVAQDTVKIGMILPMTGQQQSTGKQELAAIKLYMAQHGDMVAGKKIELIVRDDTAVADNTRRIAQELIVNDKVTFLAGFGVTPAALAVAPLATESKLPQIVTAAGTSIITEKSPRRLRQAIRRARPRQGRHQAHRYWRRHG